MKRRPPGWQKSQERKERARLRGSAPEGWGVQVLHGEDAQRAIQGLLGRIEAHPERFMFDVELED